jgi:hypothetical protein
MKMYHVQILSYELPFGYRIVYEGKINNLIHHGCIHSPELDKKSGYTMKKGDLLTLRSKIPQPFEREVVIFYMRIEGGFYEIAPDL